MATTLIIFLGLNFISLFFNILFIIRQIKTFRPLKSLEKAKLDLEAKRVFVQAVKFNKEHWVRVDDILLWLKENQKVDPASNDTYHFIIKSFVKFKNEPSEKAQ